MFVWEAVTQYLTEDGFRKTLRSLSKAAAGSRLIFTYVREDFLAGLNFYGAEQMIHRDMKTKYDVWHFGIKPENVDSLLREYGWAEREQVGPREYFKRYIEPSGRDRSPGRAGAPRGPRRGDRGRGGRGRRGRRGRAARGRSAGAGAGR